MVIFHNKPALMLSLCFTLKETAVIIRHGPLLCLVCFLCCQKLTIQRMCQCLSQFINYVIIKWAICECVHDNKRELIQSHLDKQFLTSHQSVSQSFQFVSAPGSYKVVKESDSTLTPFQRGRQPLKARLLLQVCVGESFSFIFKKYILPTESIFPHDLRNQQLLFLYTA